MNGPPAVTVDTPDGRFSILLRAGSVLASGWTEDADALAALVHPTLRPVLHDIIVEDHPVGHHDHTAGAVEAVTAYYDGDLDAPGRIPVHQLSGEFRMHAWSTLRQIAAGDRLTYAEYAARAGRPAAVRAAGAACAMNAAALFVPCHRIVRTDGGLGGFRYGLSIKQRLLEREAATAAPTTLF